jgi:hypothetical protein
VAVKLTIGITTDKTSVCGCPNRDPAHCWMIAR